MVQTHIHYFTKIAFEIGIIKEVKEREKTDVTAKEINENFQNIIQNIAAQVGIMRNFKDMKTAIDNFKAEFAKRMKPKLEKLGIKEKHQDLNKSEEDLITLLTPCFEQLFAKVEKNTEYFPKISEIKNFQDYDGNKKIYRGSYFKEACDSYIRAAKSKGIIKELAEKAKTNPEAKDRLSYFEKIVHDAGTRILIYGENAKDNERYFRTAIEISLEPKLRRLAIREQHQDLKKSEDDLVESIKPHIAILIGGRILCE